MNPAREIQKRYEELRTKSFSRPFLCPCIVNSNLFLHESEKSVRTPSTKLVEGHLLTWGKVLCLGYVLPSSPIASWFPWVVCVCEYFVLKFGCIKKNF